MRRTILTILAALLLLPAAAHAAAGDVNVSLDQCGVVNAKGQLGFVVSGDMAGIDGAKKMAIEVDIYSRAPGAAFTRIPKGHDAISTAAVALYRYLPHTFLVDVGSPTDYRARMTYRWTAADGDVTTTRRWSSVCRIAPQPDLALGDLTTTASGQPGVLRYAIPVRNDGRADAGAFDVALRIASEDRAPVTVTGLAAGATQLVTFVAPRCAPGDVLRFAVDPDDRVAEADERDNVLTVACPA